MINSIILAAGKSTRMGKDKAFLLYRGTTFIENIIKKLSRFSTSIKIISSPHNMDNIKKVAQKYGADVIINKKSNSQQIHSIKLAVKKLMQEKTNNAVLLHLVDQPHIKEKTYDKIIDAYYRYRCVIIPQYYLRKEKRFKKGHPIIIPPRYFKTVMKSPPGIGLHWFIHHSDVKVKNIKVNDRAVIEDIDTEQDYKNLTDKKNRI